MRGAVIVTSSALPADSTYVGAVSKLGDPVYVRGRLPPQSAHSCTASQLLQLAAPRSGLFIVVPLGNGMRRLAAAACTMQLQSCAEAKRVHLLLTNYNKLAAAGA